MSKSDAPEKTSATTDVDQVPDTAAKAEADGDTVSTVSWDGADWSFPTDRMDWDAEAMVAAEEGRFNVFLKKLLGPQQWRRFTSQPRTFRDADALTALILSEGVGSNRGE